jgi:hypothetical protein
LNAAANVPGTYVYNPPAGTVLSGGIYTLSVVFTPSDTASYKSTSASVSLTVIQATPIITWAAPAAIAPGTPLSATQLNAQANVPGSYIYNPAPGTLLSAGTHTLYVSFTPLDSTTYKSAAASVKLTVLQANPVVTWAAPTPIAPGTPLSAVQLNATANVPGTYIYSPAAGTVLSAGTYALSVAFTPQDAVNYMTISATVPLTVTPPLVESKIAIISLSSGNTVSGAIIVVGQVSLSLDSAGTFLMVDGQEIGTRRVTESPFIFPLDTLSLSNGPHVLQLWGHDIGNNTVLSAPVPVLISN